MTARLPFNVRKATQVVCRFIAKEGGQMNHLKLMKLLYLTDRIAFTHWRIPVIGDRYCSMEYGPMLSGVLDLVNQKIYFQGKEYWNKHISNRIRNTITNISPCEYDELSLREIQLIDNISERFVAHNEWYVVDFCHKYLKEWINPGNTSVPICLDEMLTAAGLPKNEIHEIEEENDAVKQVKELLQC